MHSDIVALSHIKVHLISVAFATIIEVLYRKTGKI